MTDVNLTAAEWFNIPGRGWVASFENGHELPEGVSARDLFNAWVNIDGKVYWVTGVETFLTLNYSRNHGFGLLIRGDR